MPAQPPKSCDAYTWIASVPDDELDELIEGLLGSEGIVTANQVYTALDAERWRRHSSVINTWPTVLWAEDSALRVVLCCPASKGVDDPDHRPGRQLLRALQASNRINSPSGFHGSVLQEQYERLECTCGTQFGDGMAKKQRAHASSLGWPVEIGGKQYTCPHMKGRLDDPERRHGLVHVYPAVGQMSGMYTCLCGSHAYDHELVEVREVVP